MTIYAHIENNEITGVYDLLPDNWRNISNFSSLINETDFLYSLGWRTIVKHNPEHDVVYQRLGSPSYQIEGDDVVETIEIINLPRPSTNEVVVESLSEEQLLTQQLQHHNNALAILRSKRDALLTETDFTQLQDVIAINGVELSQQYTTYRQALRDLPLTYEADPAFIDESVVIYPTKPGAI